MTLKELMELRRLAINRLIKLRKKLYCMDTRERRFMSMLRAHELTMKYILFVDDYIDLLYKHFPITVIPRP